MLSTYFLLCFEFLKIGLFTFGGGYASLPFLYHISEIYGWFSVEQLTQMIAISGITPGPIGLNMATFAGFKTLGFFGSLITSISLIIPMLIVTTSVFCLYKKISESKCVKSVLYFLRPTSCALILCVGLKLFYELVLNSDLTLRNVDFAAFGLVIFLFVLTFFLKRDPIIYMAIAAIIGIVVKFC